MIRYKVMGSMAGSSIGGKNIQLDKSSVCCVLCKIGILKKISRRYFSCQHQSLLLPRLFFFFLL